MNEELVLVIRSEVSKAVSGLQTVQGEADKTGTRAQAMGDKFTAAGKKMTVGLTLPIAALVGGSVAAFAKQEESIAKVNSAIESMGVEWTNTSKLQQRAADLQAASTFGDEDILHMQSVLLTFGNVTEDVFGRAEQAGIDMSAALGQDLQSSATMLGKALNDPVQGITALSRVGVSFTEQQKEQIKAMASAGDMMGAQNLMLKELEAQYGGTAKKVSETAGGQMKQAMNDFGDAMESVGAAVAPILADIAGHVSKLAQGFQKLPSPVRTVAVGALALVAALGPVLSIVGKLTPVVAKMLPVFAKVGILIKTTVIPAVLGMSAPVLAVVAAIAAAIAIGILIWKKWDVIFPAIKKVVEPVMNFIKNVFDAVMGFIGPLVETTLNAMMAVVKFVFEGIKLYIKVTLKVWQTIIAVALWAIQGIFKKVTDSIKAIWEFIWSKIGGTVKRMASVVSSTVKGMASGISTVFNGIKNTVMAIWNGIYNFFAPKLKRFYDLVTGAFTDIRDRVKGVFNGFASVIKDAFKGALQWVIDKINWAIDKINGITGTMNKIPGVNIGKISKINLGFGGENLAGTFRVGDRGKPEMVTLPAGSSVKPIPAMGGGGGGVVGEHLHFHAPQNDPIGVAREVGWELTKRGLAGV